VEALHVSPRATAESLPLTCPDTAITVCFVCCAIVMHELNLIGRMVYKLLPEEDGDGDG
jgi:hypothetical protein